MSPAIVFAAGPVISAVALSDEIRRLHSSLLRTALTHAALSIDEAAREAEIDHAQFRRQLDLLEGSHKRLAMLPASFWRWYAVVLAQRFGLPKETRIARHLARAAVTRKRMAKAGAPTRKERAS